MRILSIVLGLTLPTQLFAQKPLRVAIAANLLYPMQEIERNYQQQNDLDIQIISASSGVLYNQIVNSAPYDVYLSANEKYPALLQEQGTCREVIVFAYGQLAFWSKEKVKVSEIAGYISKLGPRSLAIAHESLAPFGTSAARWLERKVNSSVEDKIVTGENVGQVNRYIYSEAVEAAFTSNSAMHSDQLSTQGHWLLLADATPVIQSGCVLTNSSNQEQASNFLSYLLSEEGQLTLSKFGYLSGNGEL